ncbi:DUF3688 domain-containing protein [Spiroplasma citri]|uniref:lipoprotein n=1 Tax=Spiroplasma citri TaxID=2133 RepID=UPI0013A081E3|nr:lipoprotein [Spiroplasma citri]QIA73676.1 DUF3688 domain-containing protein [Spiroplasma citri]
MKKWLSIIGAIGLTITSTTTLISCEKSEKPNNNNNNNNNEENKPTIPASQPQQPPKNSNWKTINGTFNNEFKTRNNKFYIISAKEQREDKTWKIIKFKNDDINNLFGNVWNNGVKIKDIWYIVNSLYRWDGDGEPETPTIDKNTGEITDWKEQKGTK